MKKNKLPTIWYYCEKIIAYFFLAIVAILEILNAFIPAIKINATDLTLGLISSTLILIFSHIEDIKKDISKAYSAQVSTSFNDGLIWVFEKKKNRIKTLDVMAHTTQTYVIWITYTDVTIDTVRLLVCRPKNSATRHYPDEPIIKKLDDAREQAIEKWKDLQRNGKISNLEIRYYEYDPICFFAIINEQYIHYGIYKIEHDYPGYRVNTLYTLDSSDSELAYNTLNDYQLFFNHVFSNFSYPDLFDNNNA